MDKSQKRILLHNSAKAFYQCTADLYKTVEIDISFLQPALVNGAFCIELFLKFIIEFINEEKPNDCPGIHNLGKLYNLIDLEIQKVILEITKQSMMLLYKVEYSKKKPQRLYMTH